MRTRHGAFRITLLSLSLGASILACSNQQEIEVPEAYSSQTPLDSVKTGDQKPNEKPSETVEQPSSGQNQNENQSSNPVPPVDPLTNDPDPVVTQDPPPMEMPPTTTNPPAPTTSTPTTPVPTTPTPTPTTPTDPTPTAPTPVVKRYQIVGDASRRCIALPSYTSGVQVVLRDCAIAENQLFTLESLGTNAAKIVASNGYVLQIRAGAPADAALVQAAPFTGALNQMWTVEAKNYTTYSALNLRNTTFTMDAKDFGTASGTPIQVYTTGAAAANQRWIIRAIN